MITLRTDAKFDDLERLIDKIQRPGNGNLRKIADGVRQGFQDNFSSEGGAAGTPWQVLAPRTVVTRRKLGWGGSHPILKRTGKYQSSFVNANNSDHIEDIYSGNGGVTIDVGSQLARRIHERGGTTNIPSLQEGRGGWLHVGGARGVFVPARPVLGLGDQSEQRLTRIIDYVIGEMERSFWR